MVPYWSHSFVVLKCLQVHENKVKNSRTENLKMLEYRKQLDLEFSDHLYWATISKTICPDLNRFLGLTNELARLLISYFPPMNGHFFFYSKAILYCDQIGAFKLQRVHVLSGFMVCGYDAKEFRWILFTGCCTRKSAIKCVWSSLMSQAIKGIYFKLFCLLLLFSLTGCSQLWAWRVRFDYALGVCNGRHRFSLSIFGWRTSGKTVNLS